MKRLLLVTPHTIPEQSGSGINVFNFASYINTTDNIATIFSFNRRKKYKSKTILKNTTIIRAIYFNQNTLTKVLSLLLIIPTFFKQIIKHDILLIYGNKVIGYELFILIAKVFRKKVVFQSLLYGVDDLNTILGNNWLRKKTYRAILKKPICIML